MGIPTWVRDAVFYQIFPDRFANGNPENDPPNVQPWGTVPDRVHFQGGDFEGIVQNIDYLIDLGINAIYLNPIFLSPSTHRYNTVDYYRIDPKLGSITDFQRCLDRLHHHHIRLILDGVFNHCGRGFFAFNDLMENGAESPYRDWFHVKKFPVRAYTPGKARNYLGWWGYKSLPKFNTGHPAVRQYIMDVAKNWTEVGIDGWRLDVANEIDDDSFWTEFRSIVKTANPEAYLLGEIWDINPRWVGENHFDGLMNYPFRSAILNLLNAPGSVLDFITAIKAIVEAYPAENLAGMYLLLGSHDTERIKTLLNGDQLKLQLAYSLLFAFPGVAAIYYGDEIGMEGGRDPQCRRAFAWDEETWDLELRNHIKNLVAVRKTCSPLRQGNIVLIHPDHPIPVLAILRTTPEEQMLCTFNPTGQALTTHLPINLPGLDDGRIFLDILTQKLNARYQDGGLHLALPEWGTAYFNLSPG